MLLGNRRNSGYLVFISSQDADQATSACSTAGQVLPPGQPGSKYDYKQASGFKVVYYCRSYLRGPITEVENQVQKK